MFAQKWILYLYIDTTFDCGALLLQLPVHNRYRLLFGHKRYG